MSLKLKEFKEISMPHFYIEPSNINGNDFTMKGEQAHYIINVRRFNAGDEIKLFDGLGRSYRAIIITIERGELCGKILSSSFKEPAYRLCLYTAISKGERFEWLIEKCAELGATEIVPVIFERSVAHEVSSYRMDRYNKISQNASQQCGRADIMPVRTPRTFAEVCSSISPQKDTLNILPWESANLLTVKEVLLGCPATCANIFIGPEGGFSIKEIELAKSKDFALVTLGENILRVETAALMASVLVKAVFENLV
jgi:16S rRNA (uracil1498-N3)-methyltransferase